MAEQTTQLEQRTFGEYEVIRRINGVCAHTLEVDARGNEIFAKLDRRDATFNVVPVQTKHPYFRVYQVLDCATEITRFKNSTQIIIFNRDELKRRQALQYLDAVLI